MLFIDNKYTRVYYSIITKAQRRSEVPDYVERHHIVPECFFKSRKRKGRQGWINGDPDSPDNLVSLTAREHFICHLLLVKMVEEAYALAKVKKAAFRLANSNNNLYITSRMYEYAKKLNSEAQSTFRMGSEAFIKGKTAYHCGSRTEFFDVDPGPPWTLGSHYRGHGKAHTKGSKKYNDGTVTRHFFDDPGPPWVMGSLQVPNKPSLGLLKWNDGRSEAFAKDCPGAGWVLGRLPGICKGSTTGKTAWNNGERDVYSVECPGPGWVPGGRPRKPKIN